jgi:hypothetical protein
MSYPLVSVIIPSYNRAHLVGETIDSVLAQDYPNLEILVLDDGSADDTPAVLAAYGDRISWSRHDNMGETRTVNRGFSLARGEILSVLSSDDVLLPGAVRAAVDLLQAHPEVMVAYFDYLFIDDHGQVRQFWKTMDYDLPQVLADCECPPGPGAFFRRRLVETMGGRDESLRAVGDFEFWLRAAMVGGLARIPQYGSGFREHGHSTSVSGLSPAAGEELIGVVTRFFQRPDLPASVRAVQQRAVAAAYFVAGCRCGGDFWFQLRCFARAFPHISNRRRARALLELTQKLGWGRAVKEFLIRRIRQAPGVGRHYREVDVRRDNQARSAR